MSFPMAHLCIAYNVLSSTAHIKKPCDFILGAIAPDSVHFRDNYEISMKKKSHLIVGDERWGEVTNNDEWLENVLAFLNKNRDTEMTDFIYGYCTHIITDIENNIKIWTPFRLANGGTVEKVYDGQYHQESYAVDYELYLMHPHKKEIWQMLDEAAYYDIPNVVVGNEIEKMKDSILHEQFNNRESADLSSYKYATLSGMKEFIEIESQYIKKLLFNGGIL